MDRCLRLIGCHCVELKLNCLNRQLTNVHKQTSTKRKNSKFASLHHPCTVPNLWFPVLICKLANFESVPVVADKINNVLCCIIVNVFIHQA